MKEWEEWEYKTTYFPRLQFLSVKGCPKLKGLSEQLLCLKKLDIAGCNKLIISENNMDTSSLEFLKIDACPLVNIPMTRYDFLEVMMIDGGCDFLRIFPLDFFQKLSSLQLRRCENLRIISQEYAHNRLNYLTIEDCPQFESLPSMQMLLPSLIELKIIECPEVEMFPDGGLPSNVKRMSLSSLKLMASLRETNTCLETLWIQNMDVECIPDEVLLPPSLTSLQFDDCPNLEKIEYKGLCHLSYLELCNCPNLQCLPEEGLPKSISYLRIWKCPLLEQRCQNPEGQDWAKIAHIQYLHVG